LILGFGMFVLALKPGYSRSSHTALHQTAISSSLPVTQLFEGDSQSVDFGLPIARIVLDGPLYGYTSCREG
jgi:hypothetical protein